MPLLNDADTVYFGTEEAVQIYQGAELVWVQRSAMLLSVFINSDGIRRQANAAGTMVMLESSGTGLSI